MQPRWLGLTTLILSLWASGTAWGWSNHTLSSYQALQAMPEIVQAPAVAAEPIAAFLKDQETAIATELAAQESWARTTIANYPVRPDALAFAVDPARDDAARRRAFLEALRVAPDIRLALFTQPEPGAKIDPDRLLSHDAVNSLPPPPLPIHKFQRVDPGEKLAVLTVVATAADEPDYGIDINCWDDSPSDWGKRYGFGKQPFGNPALSYSTQAPFHMGFFHQDRIVYLAAPFLGRTYPMLRVRQFTGLSALAFRTGHPYWGWRFLGFALHYVQDLTQPYHASVLPGVSTTRMLLVNTLAMAGWEQMKDDMIVLVSNRHLALEQYQMQGLFQAVSQQRATPVTEALRATSRDGRYPAWSDSYIRDVLTLETVGFGDRVDSALTKVMPSGYVNDPKYDFGVKGERVDLVADVASRPSAERAVLDDTIAELMGHFGAHSRNLVRATLGAASK